MVKINITGNGTKQQPAPLRLMHWKVHILSVLFWPKMCNMNIIMRKHQANQTERKCTIQMACTLLKCQGQETQKGINLSTSKETKDTWQLNATCDPGLVPEPGKKCFPFVEKVINRTAGGIWIKSVDEMMILLSVLIFRFGHCTVIAGETQLGFRRRALRYLEVFTCSLASNV